MNDDCEAVIDDCYSVYEDCFSQDVSLPPDNIDNRQRDHWCELGQTCWQRVGTEGLNMKREGKTKMITVRVTRDLFETLRIMSISRGYRNVSDLSRAALNKLVTDAYEPIEVLQMKVVDLDQRYDALRDDLNRILKHCGMSVAELTSRPNSGD